MIRSASMILACAMLAACVARPPPSPPPPVAPPRTPQATTVPDQVTGLSASTLTAEFGQPALVRKDGIAEIWRYDGVRKDGVACHAFFFLYDNQGVRIVRHVEILPQDSQGDQPCLDTLRVKLP